MPRPRMDPEVKARLAVAAVAVDHDAASALGRAHVTEQIRRWIFEGLLRDGDVVSQEDVADVLGLSRIPVRDGLIALAAAGWVVIDPGVGARAVGLDRAAVHDSLELFGHIWTLLIRRAVERGGSVAELRAAGEAVKEAASAVAMRDANERFVRELRALAASPRLDAAFDNAARIVPGDFFTTVPNALEVQRRHVPEMARSIARGDAERACSLAMSQHRSHARNIVTLLSDRGVIARAHRRTHHR